ncbi:class I SAM-dependent methyltransferase [Biostraticola tofi]|uniref:Methyltransferase family protein n=1 Tax=Biostraticola tofi TaxID=466109 RepID=A0A4R3YNM0_9GAMM|nr:class I SAM-dependent methyltransferase [Biostraticola tofi]TCV94455.1 methyltransferase family protein [Biostraticola tofi]
MRLLNQQCQDSTAISAHYDRFPFPPVYHLVQEDAQRDLTASFNYEFSSMRNAGLSRTSRLWVPGCGTRWAVMLALQFRECQIIASDISAASLDFQRKLAANLALDNIIFRQEDLLAAGYRHEFDYVSCIGVLHHLPCPPEGLSAIRSSLKTDGMAELMVYDRDNRQYSIKMQHVLRLLEGGNSLKAGERFNLAVEFLSNLNRHARRPRELGKVLSYLEHRRGFAIELADFICNPLEHYYDVPSLLTMLDQASLGLISWKQPHHFSPEFMLDSAELRQRVEGLSAPDKAHLGSLMRNPLLECYVCQAGRGVSDTLKNSSNAFLQYRLRPARQAMKHEINAGGGVTKTVPLPKYKLENGRLMFDAGERRPGVIYYGIARDCITEEPRQWLTLEDLGHCFSLPDEQIASLLDLTDETMSVQGLINLFQERYRDKDIQTAELLSLISILCRTPFRVFIIDQNE